MISLDNENEQNKNLMQKLKAMENNGWTNYLDESKKRNNNLMDKKAFA